MFDLPKLTDRIEINKNGETIYRGKAFVEACSYSEHDEGGARLIKTEYRIHIPNVDAQIERGDKVAWNSETLDVESHQLCASAAKQRKLSASKLARV